MPAASIFLTTYHNLTLDSYSESFHQRHRIATMSSSTTSASSVSWSAALKARLLSSYESAITRSESLARSACQPPVENDGWQFHSREQDIDLYTKVESNNLQSCKGVGIIPDCDVETAHLLFDSSRLRAKLNPTCKDARNLVQLDENTNISYSAFSAPWPVAWREFLAIGRVEKNEKTGGRFSWTTSVPEEKISKDAAAAGAVASDLPTGQTIEPTKKGYVRGLLYYAGVSLEPVASSSSSSSPSTRVIYSVFSDPNGSDGSLPSMLVNRETYKQPLVIANLRDLYKKEGSTLLKELKAESVEEKVKLK